jgi:hypothetical protein
VVSVVLAAPTVVLLLVALVAALPPLLLPLLLALPEADTFPPAIRLSFGVGVHRGRPQGCPFRRGPGTYSGQLECAAQVIAVELLKSKPG